MRSVNTNLVATVQQLIEQNMSNFKKSGKFCTGDDFPTAEISLGKLEGHYKLSYEGRKFAAFEGIPYAKAPVANLRFEPPQEPTPWVGVRKVNKIYSCLQMLWLDPVIEGSEDCLYLNVYVPQNATNLDVVVYIHGGAFRIGNTELAGPEYLIDKNIVYVSMNYRLGLLGFLSTEDAVVPGNMGLKDQSMALRWIQRHIKAFGGNPNSVTISGSSAGAASVHLHYFSSLSKGLFHKGISHGGSALMPWAIHKSPLSTAKILAATIGCDNSSTRELVGCLKDQPASDVIKNIYSVLKLFTFPLVPFGPVIEKTTSGAFLSDCPHKLLKLGKISDVPWLTGAVTEEGIIGLTGFNFNYDYINENWDEILDIALNYEHAIDEMDKREVAQSIKKFYLNGENVTEDNVQDFIKLFSDRYFYVGMEKAARLQADATKSSVYAYIYGYKHSGKDVYNDLMGVTKDYGVTHGSDGRFLYTFNYGGVVLDRNLSKDDARIKDLFTNIVTSFAKSGDPRTENANWKSVSNSEYFDYLFIGNDEIRLVSKPELAPTKFWEYLPLKEPTNANLPKDEL